MFFEKQGFEFQSFEFQSELFLKFSGLKLNKQKKEFFWLGVHNMCEWSPHEFKLSIQILGVYFDDDELSRKRLILKRS